VRALRRGSIAASRVVEEAPATVTALDLPGTAGNYASTPDSVANSVTGDIDIRLKLAMDDWTPGAGVIVSLVGKYGTSGNRSYHFWFNANVLTFTWTTFGSTAINRSCTVNPSVPFAGGTTHWLRVTLDVNNDASGHSVKFFSSEDGTAWTQLGSTVTTAGTTSIFNSDIALEVGGTSGGQNPLPAVVHYAEIRNGIDGAVVNKFDPSTVTPAGTRTPNTVVADTGETWTVNGSAWDWAAV
jgi:hypothetical protein